MGVPQRPAGGRGTSARTLRTPVNVREGKPRTRGITEIRGPYYTPLGDRALPGTKSLWGRVVTYKG